MQNRKTVGSTSICRFFKQNSTKPQKKTGLKMAIRFAVFGVF